MSESKSKRKKSEFITGSPCSKNSKGYTSGTREWNSKIINGEQEECVKKANHWYTLYI